MKALLYRATFIFARFLIVGDGQKTTLQSTDKRGDTVQKLGGSGEQGAALRLSRGREDPARPSPGK